MVELLGLMFAVTAAACFGSYLVPFKKAGKVDVNRYQLLMASGILLSTLIAIPLLGFSFNFTIFGLISGIMWAVGNSISPRAVEFAGLSRAAPIWMAGVVIVSFLWGTLLFQDAIQNFLSAIIGIGLLVLGMPLIVSSKTGETKNKMKGIMLAAIAGLVFGSYVMPLRLSNLQPSNFIFSMSLGIFFAGLAIYIISILNSKKKSENRYFVNGMSSGIIWNIGNISSLFAISSIGLAIGFPLTQLAILFAVSWGVFYFKEVQDKSKIWKTVLGAIILILGAIILAGSK